jgi:hypothetical protein
MVKRQGARSGVELAVHIGGSALVGFVFGMYCTSLLTLSLPMRLALVIPCSILLGWIGFRFGQAIFRPAKWTNGPLP